MYLLFGSKILPLSKVNRISLFSPDKENKPIPVFPSGEKLEAKEKLLLSAMLLKFCPDKSILMIPRFPSRWPYFSHCCFLFW